MGVQLAITGFLWRPSESGLYDINEPNWWMSWVRPRAYGGNFGSFWIGFNGSFFPHEYVGWDGTGPNIRFSSQEGIIMGPELELDTWYWIAIGRNAVTGPMELWVDGVQIGTLTSDATSRADAQAMSLGYITGTGQQTNIDIAYMKLIQDSLTEDELLDEYYSADIVHAANAYEYWEFPNSGAIYNGSLNGRHWTPDGGNPPWVADPTIPEDPRGGEVVESGPLSISSTPTIEIADTKKEVSSGALEILASPTITISDSEVISPEAKVVESGPLSIMAHPTIVIASDYKIVESGQLSIVAHPKIDIREEQVDTIAAVFLSVLPSANVVLSYQEHTLSASQVRQACVVVLPRLEPL